MAETQYKGWRLHRRKGEALPYYNAILAASLVTPYSSLNVQPYLPAGSFIAINGQNYVTRNSMASGQWGEIDPLEWHPTYIMPKKVTDTFVDRAAVYWDATNCYATSTVGANTLIGYAVSNASIGTATNGTGSALTTAANGASSVASGTSADGLAGDYASADTFIEVEVVVATTVTVSSTWGSTATVAALGSAIGNAVNITAGFSLVSGGNNAVGVILPVAVAGKSIAVKNTGAGGLFVYPQVNSAINALGANNSINMATLTAATFVATSATQWYTVPLVPS